MKQLFQKNRISIQSLLSDTVKFVVEQFNQARTNFTVASAYGQIILVVENIGQLILYYIEDSITELNINEATRPNSIYGLARLTGHNPTRAISSTGEISLSIKQGSDISVPGNVIIIPNHTKLKCMNNGVSYILDIGAESLRVPTDGTKNGLRVNVIQGSMESQTFTGTGSPLQSFEVNFPQSIYIDHYNVSVFVNGQKWKLYDSLYDMPKDGKCVMVKTGITSGVDIYFGNGFFGMKPPLGAEIRVEYLISSGDSGNIDLSDENVAYFKWEETGFTMFGEEVELNEALSVKCTLPPDFGTNPEPIALTRLIAPKTSRNYVLANTDNYIIFFEKFNMFSIIDAYQTPDDNNIFDDKVIYLFLIPDVKKKLISQQTYFDLDESEFVLTSFQKTKILNLVEKSGSKVLGTEIKIVDPIISKYIINIALIIFEGGPSEESIKQNIIDRLSDYFLNIRRRDRIPRSDLITIIEQVEGVDSVNLNIICAKDELAYKLDPTLTELKVPGIDEFGDIIIASGELPVIRGGFEDRKGFLYEEGLDDLKASSVNIQVRGTVKQTYNTDMNTFNKIKIKNQ